MLAAPYPALTRTILCGGKNHREHAVAFHGSGFDATAGSAEILDAPITFVKHPSSVIACAAPISSNDPTGRVDYEGELAVVIGEPAFRVRAAEAMRHVYGYTIVNDVTSRESQSKHKQGSSERASTRSARWGPIWSPPTKSRTFLRALRLRTYENDELRQDATLAELIFDIPTLIATISATTSLRFGDLIATGTPAGVGIGFSPPRYLHPGDRIRVAIDGLGELVNPVA